MQINKKICEVVEIDKNNSHGDRQLLSVLVYMILFHKKESEVKDILMMSSDTKTFTYAANMGDILFPKLGKDEFKGKIEELDGYESRKQAADDKRAKLTPVYAQWEKMTDDEKQKVEESLKEKDNKKDVEINGTKINKADLVKLKKAKGEGELNELIDKESFYVRRYYADGTDKYFVSMPRMTYNELQTRYTNYFVKPLYKDVDTYLSEDISNVIGKIVEVSTKLNVDSLRNMMQKYFENSRESKNMNNSNIIEEYLNGNDKQIIFTGAPGTGKTHRVREYVKNAEKCEYKFIQFHSSYDYSDFIEGLRPVLVNDETTFVRMDGTFKEFCRLIIKEYIDELKKTDEFMDKDDATIWAKYTEEMNNENSSFPEPQKRYYFIIDEINRADLSKVFGELMFGLEESYRGFNNKFDTQYKNLLTYVVDKDGKANPLKFDCFKEGFFVPNNLYIIGTMNDIDRSVETFDFALRRRFRWIEISANGVMEDTLTKMLGEENASKIIENIKDMNDYISTRSDLGLNKAYNIGAAYFKTYNGENLNDIWLSRVEPILREYCRGRKEELVLGFTKECHELLMDGKGKA